MTFKSIEFETESGLQVIAGDGRRNDVTVSADCVEIRIVKYASGRINVEICDDNGKVEKRGYYPAIRNGQCKDGRWS